MRVVFVSDMWIWVTYEERVHVYIPFTVALERPDWEVHLYMLYNNDNDISVLEKEYGKSVPNFHLHLYKEDDERIDIVQGDMLFIVGTVPSIRPAFNHLLLNLDELRKKYQVCCYYALDSWEGWFNNKVLHTTQGNYCIPEVEMKVARAMDFVFAVSPQLCVHINAAYHLDRPVYWLPNAANQQRYKLERGFQVTDKIVAVYIGTLFWARSDNTDWDASLRSVALQFPQIQFYFIGSFAEKRWGDTLIPPQPYFKNLLYIHRKQFDANIKQICENATFFISLLGRNVFGYYADPTKWYVYHALNRPILSLNSPHHAAFPEVYANTITHHNLEEGIKEMLRALQRGITLAPVNPNHDWLHRAKTLLSIIEKGDAGYGFAENGAWQNGRLP